jgi:hypothetical protein
MKLKDILDNHAHILSEEQPPPPAAPMVPEIPGVAPLGSEPGEGVPVDAEQPDGTPNPAIAQPDATGEPPPPPETTDPNAIPEPTPMTKEGEFDYVKAMARALTTTIDPDDSREVDDLIAQMDSGEITADLGRPIRSKLDKIIKRYSGETDLPRSEQPPAL